MTLETLIPLITGSGGALTVMFLAWYNEREMRKQAQQEYRSISREAIECLTKLVSREESDKEWRAQASTLLQDILATVKKHEK